MKKLLTLTTSLAAIATSTAVLAADLPSKRVAPVAPVVPVFTWTGFYAGVNAGVNWSNRNVNQGFVDTSGALTGAALEAIWPSAPAASNNRTGFIGGIQVGYNYQINQFVIGAEADFMGAALNKTTNASGTTLNYVPGIDLREDYSTKIQQQWLGTVRARAGFAIDRVFVYATGGLAYGDVKISLSNTETGAGVLDATWAGQKTQTKAGYTFGAGAEYAITNNWIIRGEYLYYNLGNVSVNSVVVSATYDTTTFQGRSKTTIDGNIVRAAISYKF